MEAPVRRNALLPFCGGEPGFVWTESNGRPVNNLDVASVQLWRKLLLGDDLGQTAAVALGLLLLVAAATVAARPWRTNP